MPISDGFYKSKISGNGWVLDVHHVSQPTELVPFCVKGVAARARKRARRKPLAVDSSDDDDDQRDGDGEGDEEEGNMEDDDEDDDAGRKYETKRREVAHPCQKPTIRTSTRRFRSHCGGW